MKKVTGRIYAQVLVECPHCEATIDLTETHLAEDGYIYKAAMNGSALGCDDLNEKIQCLDCGKTFNVGKIEW